MACMGIHGLDILTEFKWGLPCFYWKEMATNSSILAWKSNGQRNLVGYSPWDHKSPA